MGNPEIGLLSSLLYSVYFVSQYILCMRRVYASLLRVSGMGRIVEPFPVSEVIIELERYVQS